MCNSIKNIVRYHFILNEKCVLCTWRLELVAVHYIISASYIHRSVATMCTINYKISMKRAIPPQCQLCIKLCTLDLQNDASRLNMSCLFGYCTTHKNVVLLNLQCKTLQNIHTGHLSVKKCKKRVKAVWWPEVGVQRDKSVQFVWRRTRWSTKCLQK